MEAAKAPLKYRINAKDTTYTFRFHSIDDSLVGADG